MAKPNKIFNLPKEPIFNLPKDRLLSIHRIVQIGKERKSKQHFSKAKYGSLLRVTSQAKWIKQGPSSAPVSDSNSTKPKDKSHSSPSTNAGNGKARDSKTTEKADPKFTQKGKELSASTKSRNSSGGSSSSSADWRTVNEHKQPLVLRPASVALLIRRSPIIRSEYEIFYILRQQFEGDPWSGQVAFPGGKSEPGETPIETAVREVIEEIGVDLGEPIAGDRQTNQKEPINPPGERINHNLPVTYISDLEPIVLGKTMAVHCLIFEILDSEWFRKRVQLENGGEVAAAGWFPISDVVPIELHTKLLDHENFKKTEKRWRLKERLATYLLLNEVVFESLPIVPTELFWNDIKGETCAFLFNSCDERRHVIEIITRIEVEGMRMQAEKNGSVQAKKNGSVHAGKGSANNVDHGDANSLLPITRYFDSDSKSSSSCTGKGASTNTVSCAVKRLQMRGYQKAAKIRGRLEVLNSLRKKGEIGGNATSIPDISPETEENLLRIQKNPFLLWGLTLQMTDMFLFKVRQVHGVYAGSTTQNPSSDRTTLSLSMPYPRVNRLQTVFRLPVPGLPLSIQTHRRFASPVHDLLFSVFMSPFVGRNMHWLEVWRVYFLVISALSSTGMLLGTGLIGKRVYQHVVSKL